jgi:dTDP-4-amino-4,6-dideoxygalactose transaminase
MKVPYLDLPRQNDKIAPAFINDLIESIDESRFILGDDVARFENEYCAFSKSRFAIGVANGTDAIELSVRALEISGPDEVVIPTNSFIASALGVTRAGATPVFCDSDENFHIDLKSAERVLSDNTKAIVVVSLYGQLPNMDKVLAFSQKFNLKIIEDFAQAQGATFNLKHAGTFGDVAGTSFYPGKNLGALGDGGAVTTQDERIRDRIVALRNYGSPQKYQHPSIGFNSRLDAIQARFLSRKLRYLQVWNGERQEIAAKYNKQLAGLPDLELPKLVEGSVHAWHIYALLCDSRDELQKFLASEGVQTLIHYPTPIHLHGAYAEARYDKEIELANYHAAKLLSLPLFPGMTEFETDFVISKVREFYSA